MHDRQELDDLFRDRLGQAEKAPPPHIWEGVKAAGKSNRKGGGWMIWGLMGIALLYVIGKYVVMDYYAPDNEPVVMENQEGSADHMDQLNDVSPFISNEVDVIEQQGHHHVGRQDEGSAATPMPQETVGLLQEQGKPQAQSTPASDSADPLARASNQKESNHEANNDKVGEQVEGNTQGKTTRPLDGVSNSAGSSSAKGDTDKKDFPPGSRATSNRSGQENVHMNEQSPAKTSHSESSSASVKEQDKLNKADMRKARLIDQEERMLFMDSIYTPIAPSKYRFRTLSLEAYGTGAKPVRQFGSGVDQNAKDEFGTRSILGWAAGAGLSARLSFNDRWILTSGLEWRAFSEELSAVEITSNTLSQLDSIGAFQDSLGNWYTIFDTVQVTTFDTAAFSATNRFHTFSVPLLVSIQKNWRKVGLSLETGPVIHVVKKLSGTFYPTPNGDDFIPIPQVYANWRLEWHAGVRVDLALNNRWSIHSRFFGRYGMQTHNDLLKHRFSSAGIALGINYLIKYQ